MLRHAAQFFGIILALVILAGCAATKQAAVPNGNGNAASAAIAAPNVTGQWEGTWKRTDVVGPWSVVLEQREGGKLGGVGAAAGFTPGGQIEGELVGRRLYFTVGSQMRAELTISGDGTTMGGFLIGVGRNWVDLRRVQ